VHDVLVRSPNGTSRGRIPDAGVSSQPSFVSCAMGDPERSCRRVERAEQTVALVASLTEVATSLALRRSTYVVARSTSVACCQVGASGCQAPAGAVVRWPNSLYDGGPVARSRRL